MKKLCKKLAIERSERFAKCQYVLGHSCPFCRSHWVLMQWKDVGKLHLGTTKLACWECLSEFTVDESHWITQGWLDGGKSSQSADCPEKQVAGNEPGAKGENRVHEGPFPDVPADSVPLDDSVKAQEVPQAEQVKKGKKANRKAK